MSYLPQENATITKLVSAQTVEDWDTAETDGAIWSGSVGSYCVDNLTTVYSDSEGALRRVRDTKLYVGVDWAQEVGVQEGWFVIFNIGGIQHKRQIKDINVPSGGAVLASSGELAGLPNIPATLHLNPDPIEF